MASIRPVRGTHDLYGETIRRHRHVIDTGRETARLYGYEEIQTPIFEFTEIFKRSLGDTSDVVTKEMYTFEDRGGESLTLRPEATAGLVRAAITNGLLHNQRHRLWTSGPMFRYERPQKGRFRQFHQIDCEAFGYEGPDVDAEMILLSARLWRALGVTRVQLQLNSLGTPESRRDYRNLLVRYFESHGAVLDEDSRRRLGGNPLRILDSKNPAMQPVIAAAPLLTDHLDAASRAHFDGLRAHLDACGIAYTVNPRLVRGLDYYSRTVFEWTTDALGAQDAVCSGGRYDGLVTQLGGEPTPAIGWALGVERIAGLLRETGVVVPSTVAEVYVVLAGELAERRGLALVERWRDALPGVRMAAHLGGMEMEKNVRRHHHDPVARRVLVAVAKNRFPDVAFDDIVLDLF